MPGAEVILFADAEQLVADWLDGQIDVDAGTSVPDPRPSAFVVLRRIGGVQHTKVTDAALIQTEYWAGLESAASAGAALVRGLLNSLPGTTIGAHMVCAVNEAAGPQNLPDPLSAQARYIQSHEIHIRGAAR